MGKKRGGGAPAGGADGNWDTVKGWKQVEVGDDFLLGSEEFGFMGLEELDASAYDAEVFQAAAEPPAVEESEEQPAKKRKTKGKAATGEAPESMGDLKARLEALEAENEELRGNKPGKKVAAAQEDGDAESKGEAKRLKAKAKREKKKKKKEKKLAKRAASYAEDEEEDVDEGLGVDVSAWDDYQLDSRILGALSKMGFSAPTHVQAECLPAAIRDRRDVIGAAQTGSGKTLAFGLPIIQLLAQAQQDLRQEAEEDGAEPPPSPLRALILAPTRELAMQVCDHIAAVGRGCGQWVVPIVGGISAQKQERMLSKYPAVVVATPGRLWELMRDGQPHLANLRGLRFLVIDEADRMVQQGHYSELTSILEAIPASRRVAAAEGGDGEEGGSEDEGEELEDGERKKGKGDGAEPALQTFVFSATLTLPGELRKRLRKGGGGASGSSTLESLMDRVPFAGRSRPKIVDLTSQRRLADKVTEACISCSESERDDHLYCLLAAHPGRTIVFVNAISAVRRLAAILKLLGLPVHPLHAGMQQRARLKALDRFRADSNAILVATDVAARGLDVKDVRCVVHYQLPASVDVYVHRSGRTARAEAEGLAIALVTPKEDARFRALLRALGRAEPPEFPLDATLMRGARERVRLATRLDGLARQDSKKRADDSWRRQHAEELGLELSEDDEDDDVIGRRVGKKARKTNKERKVAGQSGGKDEEETVRAELGALLAVPLQPKFSRRFFTGGAASGVALQQRKSNGEGEGNATATVAQAVGMAQRLSDAQAVAATATTKKKKGGGGKQAAPAKRAPQKPVSRAAALAAAVRKQMEKKQRKKSGGGGGGGGGGLVVVPKAFGRAAQGPDALQALRTRLALTSE